MPNQSFSVLRRQYQLYRPPRQSQFLRNALLLIITSQLANDSTYHLYLHLLVTVIINIIENNVRFYQDFQHCARS